MSVAVGPDQRYLSADPDGRYYVATQLINQSGLIVNLDASVPQSYPGSGSTWTNLATSNNITLGNTYSYTTDAYGGITFGATGIGVSNSAVSFSSGWTMSTWVKHTSTLATSVQRYLTVNGEAGVLRHGSATASSLHGYLFNNAGTFYSTEIDAQIYINNYYNLTATFNNSILSVYNNGQLCGVTGVVTLPIKTPDVLQLSATGESFLGNMYTVQMYNRALSQTEITKNFNILRGRFGV